MWSYSDMKRRTVQWWPQEEWTHNRWATLTLNRPRPSALITVEESHGTRPIKPHYLDRENMRVKEKGVRKEPHSTITNRNPKNKSSVCFIHSFKKRSCVLSFFFPQPFSSPPPWSVRLALAHPYKQSHHSAHLCQTSPPNTNRPG